ncbi:MAG: CHASE2 domain-containing protein [Candidatus Omnitrophica bacterium]|nr:CHASE2 domain-containing protein [Candidatus Omnitrophota bacterium]
MKILNISDLKKLIADRHNRRGYYDSIKMILSISVGIIVLFLFLYDTLERFELTTFDYRMRIRSSRDTSDKIVLIDMGEDSIKSIGRWPWPREWHATMIMALSQYNTAAVVFDVIFSEESNDLSDGALEEAMKTAGNVYIPYAIELDKFNKEKKRWDVGNLIVPLRRFSRWAKGQGHITIVPDIDGTIRKSPLVIDYNGKAYPQLGFRVACNLMGLNPEDYTIIRTPFSRYLKIGTHRAEYIYVPVDDKNQMIVNWAGKWGEAFKHYSYVDIITSFQSIRSGGKPLVDLAELEGKICIIGLTAAGLYDIKPNTLQPTYPAVGTNANIMNSVLNGDFVKKAPRWIDSIIILFLAIILSINISKVRHVRGLSIMALMVAAYTLISFAVLEFFNVWISFIYPLMAVTFSFLSVTFYNQVVISIERAKLFTLATKDGLTGLFVIRHFSLLLEAEMSRVKARGGRLSIVMSDIDHFKKINDTHGHQAGDFILKEVASIFMSCCRQLDIPSRYGGEEFIMMLPGADVNDAAMVAERVRSKVEKHAFKMGDKVYKANISLGVATYEGEEIKDDLIKKADNALYEAKDTGRNKVCIAEPKPKEETTDSKEKK